MLGSLLQVEIAARPRFCRSLKASDSLAQFRDDDFLLTHVKLRFGWQLRAYMHPPANLGSGGIRRKKKAVQFERRLNWTLMEAKQWSPSLTKLGGGGVSFVNDICP
jgi:hypothetical protein